MEKWNSFERKIYIKTSIEKLYNLWATTSGIKEWFLKDAKYERGGIILLEEKKIEADDVYTWQWHNWEGSEEGKVISANGKDFIQFTFAKSILDVKLIKKNKYVIVELKQHNIPNDEESKLKIYCGCNSGWTFWLTNLKAYLEHGILLNETEVDLKSHDMHDFIFVNM